MTVACDNAVEAGDAPVTTLARDLLWPANHSLVDVGFAADPTPVCAGLLDFTVTVWSDEPAGASADARFDVPEMYLRAKRLVDPGDDGRVYLVITRAETNSGIVSRKCGTIVVPKSGSGVDLDLVRQQAAAAESACMATGEPPAGFQPLAEAAFSEVNEAPVVDGGPEFGIAGSEVTIDATVTDDGLPNGQLEVEWTQEWGTGQATFSDARAEDPTVTFSEPGVYFLRLTAGDGELQSSSDLVEVHVGTANQAPIVNAGDDQTLIVPDMVADLEGSATDDGLPSGEIHYEWGLVSQPDGATVSFLGNCSNTCQASFSHPGEYVLLLLAYDLMLDGVDTVRIVVNPAPLPTLEVANGLVLEGHDGRTAGELPITLSHAWPRPVTFDYLTLGGTASVQCDYTFSYGTFTIEAGVTETTLLIPVVGDLADEADETVMVVLGNAVEGVLATGQAALTITDDDGANASPTAHASRQPPDDSAGLGLPPTLSWSSGDPDAGDTVTHDVFLGSALALNGQSWSKSCPATSGPSPSTAFASDGERLLVLEQETDGSSGSDVYVLDHANGSGGAPAWTTYATQNGPHLASARAAYDAAGDRLIVVGRCLSNCTDGLETWVLAAASGGGSALWTRIATMNAPAEASGFALAYAAATNRLYLFGGVDAGGSRLDDLWVLDGANGSGTPAWTLTAPAGPGPSARDGASLVVDARQDRLILFGGSLSATEASSETWTLGIGGGAFAWQLLATGDQAPTARSGHAAVLDRGSGRMLVFGGTTPGIAANTNFVLADAWLLDGSAWTEVAVPPLAPVGRYDAIVAYSAEANRLIVSAGRNNKVSPEVTRDLWLLSDAMGRLPAVALGQPASSFVPSGLDVDRLYFWRGVTRDSHGAWRGAPVWRFTGNESPTVNAGEDQSITLPATASLLANSADDGHPAPPDLTLAWTRASGPGSVTFNPPGEPATTVTFGAPGTYILTATVSDGMLNASDDLTVVVIPSNLPPVVNAGPDEALIAPNWTAELEGEVRDDDLPPPPSLVTTWSKLSGPGEVDFDSVNDPLADATFAAVGEYVLRLTATDGEQTRFDDVRIDVFLAHDLVIPSMNASQMVTDPNTLAVSGTVSVDVDNLADGPIAQVFVVKVFEDRNGNGTFEATDNLLGSTEVPGLAAHAATRTPVTVSGTVLFAGNRVHAFVDATAVVPEGDEANNYRDTATPCAPFPTTPFSARLKWAWEASAPDPSRHVMMTPAVGDLDGDGMPEIVFVSNPSLFLPGKLRAISGASGQLLFSATEAVNSAGQIAIGDIDRDGSPEIVALRGQQVLAFEDTGVLKWITGNVIDGGQWSGPALADLDDDGTPEIIIGRHVLNAHGSVRWKGAVAPPATDGGLSIVADLDLDPDGKPEVIAGPIAYRANGDTYWKATGLSDGFSAVANFDDDANPEVVMVSAGQVWLFEHNGLAKWGPVEIPGGGVGEKGGAPMVADVDGEDPPEIGVAGALNYVLLNADGTIRWASPIIDISSHTTSSAAFDFEGDGKPEIVYRDHTKLRVYRGDTGAILFETPVESPTGYESPVVADVNGDGTAEIVTVSYGGPHPGVHVFESASTPWAPTRKIWNQHTYHVTNVAEDLTIPSSEVNNWEIYNNYRQNSVTSACALPDLTASYLRRNPLVTDKIELTARIGNNGSLTAPAVQVAFYADEPTTLSPPLATGFTGGTITPGGFRDVTIQIDNASVALPMWVVADDSGGLAGTVMEGDENNNKYKSRLYLTEVPNEAPTVSAGPDIAITWPMDEHDILGVADDDGLPINQLTVAWGLVSSDPDGLEVSFSPPDAAETHATFEGPGTYRLVLRGSDVDLDSQDEVIVEVLGDLPDLAVPSVNAPNYAVDPQTLITSGLVSAQIHNGGTQDAGPFAATAYEEIDGQPGFDSAEDNALGSVTISGLDSQASTTAYIAVDGTVQFAGEDVRVAVDPDEVVGEQRETNNHGRAPHGCEIAGGCAGSEPDLIPSYVRTEDTGAHIRVTARIGNAGDTAVSAGTAIGFYDGNPTNRLLIGSLDTPAPIPAGGFIDISIEFDETGTARPIWVVADDPDLPNGGRVAESVESNNSYDSRIFHPSHANDPPAVDAGLDVIVDHPSQHAELDDAVVIDDGVPGVPLAYRWRQMSGPGTAIFTAPLSLDTGVGFSTTGHYVLRLEVDDSEKVGLDDIAVDVDPANAPPTVSAGPDASSESPRFQLAGSVQDDGLPRNAPLTIVWSVVSGPPGAAFDDPSDPNTFVTVTAAGLYRFRLTANDTAGPVTAEVDRDVTFVNQAPVPTAVSDGPVQLPDRVAALTGSYEDDGLPQPSSYTYTWSQVSGASPVIFAAPNAATTDATFADPGTYRLRLTVSDGALAGISEVDVPVLPETGCGAQTAAIVGPAAGSSITQPTMVVGTVTSDSLASWQLHYRLAGGGGGGQWTRFGFGTAPAANGNLAPLDTTLLLNGLYDVRLTATSTCGGVAQAQTQVVVRDNFKVGHFTVSFVDMEVPVAGMPLQITRTYDSRDKRMGDFGYGWRLDVSNVRIEETGITGAGWVGTRSPGDWPTYCLQSTLPKVVTVTLPNGRVLEFDAVATPRCQSFSPPTQVVINYQPRSTTRGILAPLNANPAWVIGAWPAGGPNPQPTPMQLFQDSDFTLFDPELYELTLPDGRELVISQTAGLQTIRDLNGNVLTVTVNGVQHSSGPLINIARQNGRVTAITDPDGKSIVYGVNASGDLETVTDREEDVTRFTYHAEIAHHLETIKDPLNRVPIRNDYHPDGRLWKHTDAYGKTIEYIHDIANRVERIKDRNDVWKYLKYDVRGNVKKEGRLILPNDPEPSKDVIEREFNDRNFRLWETIPYDPSQTTNPPKTTYVPTPNDEVERVTDPEGKTTQYQYNARGQLLWSKDPKALAAGTYYTTFNSYHATTGNLMTTADAEGTLTEYTYDPADRGNVSSQKVTANGVVLSWTEYDYGNGVLTEERNLATSGAILRKTQFVNGIHGVTRRKTWRTLPTDPPQQEMLETVYLYDDSGRIEKTTDPDGTFTRTEYNAAGQPWKTFDKSNRMTEHVYDDMGRLEKTIYPGGSFEEITYRPEGQRETFKDRMGYVTHYCYDDAGRLERTRPPQATAPPPLPASPCSTGAVVENVYDDAGRLWKTIDAEDNLTEYEYWPSGRRKKVIDAENAPLGKFTLFEYDATGNLQFLTDPKGEVTEYQYDKANRRTKTKPPIVNGDTQREMTTAYVGRTRTETDLAGKVTTFESDELGQLVKVTDANGKETMYGYDEVGNRISQTDARGRVTRFEYDKLGRETKRILPGGGFETKTYTVDGSLDLHTDFNGHVTDYDYDPITGRLTSKDYADATMPDVAFTYYPDGRRETVTAGTAQTLYDYDLRRRLKLLQYPDGRKLEYLYDHNGNRTSLKATLGTRVLDTLFSYDGNNRLKEVTDPDGRVYAYGYDPNGNRETLDYPNDAHTQYIHDEQNRLRDLTTTHPGTPPTTIQSYAFTLYPAGNRHTIAEAGGTLRTYVYDDLYRLTSETVTGGPHEYGKVFTYDDVGNRETQTTTGGPTPPPGAISYGYDDRDRLTTETGVTGGYGYDTNGNLTDKADGATDYAWDRDNRMTTVTLPDGTTVAHAYDADGNRVQTTTTPPGGPAAVTNYLVDTSGSLSHVVAETDAAGALTAYYVRGDDLLAVMRPTGPTTWATKYVHADGIGSIRKLTNESGAITDTYAYSAFGERLGSVPTDPQPYAFAGEPLDPNVGLQYHRARWMDPGLGRFVSVDRWRGVSSDPLTLHRYLYARARPADRVDPSGHFDVASAMLTVGIIGVLASISAATFTGIFNLATRPGPNNALTVRTDVLVAQSSGWNEAEAVRAVRDASDVWFQMARIRIDTGRVSMIDDDGRLSSVTDNTVGYAIAEVQPFLAGKHATVFVGDTGPLSGGVSPRGAIGGRGYSFISGNYPAFQSWTVAHEWGHTFSLSHSPMSSANPFSAMEGLLFLSNLMNPLASGTTLTPGQREQARAYVEGVYQ